ncbi:MAG: AMP-dependent synthetase [SAR86 cluster bacterium]|uniref:AMP-dependent synthetase n=1 Tax=SAR86 cluster bacterium TaxID=2030880 RepID=A0A2A4X4U8_9GAMM|nr:MAG: AMP-dependent synthetase [SAR86 cluster bacterium]
MHTFADPINYAARMAPTKTAVIDGAESIDYAALHRRCRLLAGALLGLGLEKGDRVAILANNGQRYIETYMGVPAAGLVVVPLNTRHAMAELKYALEDSQTKVLLIDRDPGELADCVDHVIMIPDAYDTLLNEATEIELGINVEESDLAGLFYTGGTTGKSKGVMLSHRNLIANTFHYLASVPQREDDVMLVMAPLFHAAGSLGVIGNIWTLGTQVTLAAFDPKTALDLIAEHGITESLGVPTMLAAIAEEQHVRPRKIDTLKTLAHGGSPIATEILRRTHSAFPSAELIEVYGATELSPLCTVLSNEQDLIDSPLARSCGRPALGNEIDILDSHGSALAAGEIGEVVVRGPNVMQGYWNKPEQTAAVIRDGAYWTGDLGYMDDQGYVFLVDRSKDMIVTGGENVYCTEVEEVLYQYPGILEAAVFGVPDDKWGEAVWAVIVPREGNEIEPAQVIEFCRERIAGYKVPKGLDVQLEPLPKSGPGKVLKRELRAPHWEGQERSVN